MRAQKSIKRVKIKNAFLFESPIQAISRIHLTSILGLRFVFPCQRRRPPRPNPTRKTLNLSLAAKFGPPAWERFHVFDSVTILFVLFSVSFNRKQM